VDSSTGKVEAFTRVLVLSAGESMATQPIWWGQGGPGGLGMASLSSNCRKATATEPVRMVQEAISKGAAAAVIAGGLVEGSGCSTHRGHHLVGGQAEARQQLRGKNHHRGAGEGGQQGGDGSDCLPQV
jgi:hypothetical protein